MDRGKFRQLREYKSNSCGGVSAGPAVAIGIDSPSSGSGAVDRSSTGTRVPRMWALTMSLPGRYCCKSRKLHHSEFLVKPQNEKRSTIRTTPVALAKSPVSFAWDDEVSQISTRKQRQRPSENLIPSTKRLLQHYRHKAAVKQCPSCVRFRGCTGRRISGP